jgi:HSP20 family protein
MAEKRNDVARREERALTQGGRFMGPDSPFRLLEHFADEVDRVFNDFGVGLGWLAPRLRGSRLRSSVRGDWEGWAPAVEVFQRNNELVVRADLPGISKDDIKVDVTDDSIIMRGERKQGHEEEREGVYRSERSYGSFYRAIPLPAGAIAESAKATFKDGVLEITMPAPPEQARSGRRVEITEGSPAKK